jgi:hypothetical protein
MPTSKIRIEAGEAEFILTIPHRDAMLLAGPRPFLPNGDVFVKTLGIYDNFTVARGVPKDSKAVRNRHHLLLAAMSLLETIERDLDLLEFDYSYSFSARSKARGGGGEGGFQVQGYFASIDTRPSGFCTLELRESSPHGQGRVVQLHDLRNRQTLDTDDSGPLRIHRQKGDEVTWKHSLPALIEFLKQQKCAEVVIHHHA